MFKCLVWDRRLRRVLILCLASTAVATPGVARAATIRVTTTDDSMANDGLCSLREAVAAANTDAAVGGCRAGAGFDVVRLQGTTYPLTIPPVDDDDTNDEGDLDVTGPMRIEAAHG